MSSPLRRALLIGSAILLFVVLVGATYQGVTTALERRRFPHPGRLVDIGGHQLHIHCTGTGAPTVLLEAPAVAMSSAWAWVQTEVAVTTRVCSYDRSGLGWSEMGDRSFTPRVVSTQLNALVRAADERGPFVVTGAELGASFALLYASNYPDDTSALVLVNAPGPASRPATETAGLAASPWLARTGLLRAMRNLSNDAAALPPEATGALTTFLNRPDHLTRAASELERWDEVIGTANSAPQRQSLPVTQVAIDGRDQIALLADPRNAHEVAAAIVRAVKVARARASGGV